MDITSSRSKSDLKTYRVIRLVSGLEVLLISSLLVAESKKVDPANFKAAAALAVQVGSFFDPVEARKLDTTCSHLYLLLFYRGMRSLS